ncbi:MBL fold metallo-hydrolase [Rhodovulum adriaticum]|uniref:Glyoxylase-like metal-dependent hydrolase (Beta-lactamase superfamily II) n=1 Tax=Rhodovulum adriaticum TaxID=35804 RepID=A0A4R2P095_RHOAD|nr:MBL fold metallo-hydrolase [Rhodovulum adriaticum]MBK1634137.1 MBL fold metallo-hydrolase [Rhodovulum adriaticum]TCP27314.1 glyoxylase-like metal-dependent hydrolase (beta-lactamase superfamily II) [Rhodovulum adriaticum]
MTKLTRRQALAAGAAVPLAAAMGSPARAAAPMMGAGMAPYHRFRLGGFEVTTLLAGTRTVPEPQKIFGLNVTPETFAAASAAAMIPTDKAQFFFTPTVVNTGSDLILFDTGLNPAGITDALAAAGYSPDQVDKVVITHMHGDHIGGLSGEAGETFANAAYYTGATEFDAWDMSGNEGFEAKVRPLADKTTFLDDGGAVASGVTAMAAFGHTPGHMAYMLESDGAQLVLGADFANHYVWSLAHPEWEVLYDRDKEMAAATRKRMLGMMAADKVPFIGYHMPFPGIGFVEARDSGYRYVPASYQFMLG